MPDRFEKRLEQGPPVVTDGGMGVLVSSAVPRLRCPEEANIRSPESVISLHTSFISAGAELIETNTFGANRHKLRSQYLEDELAAINEAGVKLAREAREVSGRDVYVAGSIGPLGELGDLDPAERGAIFAEQAELLAGRGVDLFMVETFFDLDELTTAIEAVQSVAQLPTVALLTFDEDAETYGGVSARDAIDRLAEYDLAAIGANHGAGLHAALAALEAMGNGRPLAALPNVGLASLSGGRVIYPHATPEYFAEFAAQARALGARVIGGCCGTTPIEIEAIARAVEEERAPTVPFASAERELVVAAHERPAETELARMLREGEWVTSVELDPPKGGTYDSMLAVTNTLKEAEVGFVDINDNPMARARANALMAAIAIERTCGVETIPHVTPRDTSIMGLQSQLLAAHAEGVRNILAVTGDPPHVGDYPGSRGVYEVDSIGLSQIVSRLNAGEDYNGKAIDGPTSFFLGVAVNPSADDIDTELERFQRKVAAGAQFAMTQALFDLSYLDRFEERLGGWPIPILVGIFMVRSHQLAVRLHNEVPGIVVPEAVQERLRDAGPGAAAEGLLLARELYAEARDKAAGVYVIPPFKQPEAALELLG
ncbi:MAG TPA: bifunctional homocysteine S-methyltransferase/methylenetetrahydrofolate reductase [Gaiellaceae bacterium]|jgi:methionine synthase I (cobalamin-dependent)/5,10-methylenetetrahydrofolate reductase|nr:bifunctional homocysteine S-methyltransferase/methylenetetrahydrofolate reductase [Gaiellaceae bacterium]